MPAYLSPIGNEPIVDANGDPLSGGKIYTYLAGTSTAAVTYTDSDGLIPQSNPVVLNSRGAPDSPIWLPSAVSMKLVVKDASDNILSPTYDDVLGINDPSASTAQDQWVALSSTPTFLSATSFSVSGDQTPTLQVGRRLKSVNSGGTVYSTILTSSFGGGITTVTVANDSSTLDSGLSAISYGLLSSTDNSEPLRSGQVLQALHFTDAGGATTSLTAANINTSGAKSITPKSKNSKIVIICTFDGQIALVAGANATAQYQLRETTGGGTTLIGVAVSLSARNAAGDLGAIAPSSVIASVSNAALTARTFLLTALTNNAAGAATGNSQQFVILEVQQ
jgi:hypothetical protein